MFRRSFWLLARLVMTTDGSIRQCADESVNFSKPCSAVVRDFKAGRLLVFEEAFSWHNKSLS